MIHRSTSMLLIRADYRHPNSSTTNHFLSSLSSFSIIPSEHFPCPPHSVRVNCWALGNATVMRPGSFCCSSGGDQNGLYCSHLWAQRALPSWAVTTTAAETIIINSSSGQSTKGPRDVCKDRTWQMCGSLLLIIPD